MQLYTEKVYTGKVFFVFIHRTLHAYRSHMLFGMIPASYCGTTYNTPSLGLGSIAQAGSTQHTLQRSGAFKLHLRLLVS